MLHSIRSSRSYENQIVHVEEIPSSQPEHVSIELKPLINYALAQMGIKQLYSHQAEAIKDDVVERSSTSTELVSVAYKILLNIVPEKLHHSYYITKNSLWPRYGEIYNIKELE